jgi:hypothetical protein
VRTASSSPRAAKPRNVGRRSLLGSLPEPEAAPDDEGWLFDSWRDYLDQLEHYKTRKA